MLKPLVFAAATIVAIADGEVSVVRTTHSARTSCACARGEAPDETHNDSAAAAVMIAHRRSTLRGTA